MFDNVKFGALEEVVSAILIFMDKVIGWLGFVLGGNESPDEFTNGLWEILGIEPPKAE